MSLGEIILILIIAILVLGPDKLPNAIINIAKIIKTLKTHYNDIAKSVQKEINDINIREEAAKFKDEFNSQNQSIKDKLNLNEFNDLKNDLEKDLKSELKDIENKLNTPKSEKNV